MFCIGDQVVHPMHGAGVIDDIVRERIGVESREYYVFRMPVGGLLLKIPTANTAAVGLRALLEPGAVEQVLEAIPSMDAEETSNWNKRYRENLSRLKSGDLYQVAQVIKILMHRDARRGLSTGERKMLHSAKQILISEMVLTEHVEYAQAEARLDSKMMQQPQEKEG